MHRFKIRFVTALAALVSALSVLTDCGSQGEVARIGFVSGDITSGNLAIAKDGATLIGVQAYDGKGDPVDVSADSFGWGSADTSVLTVKSLGGAALLTGVADWFDTVVIVFPDAGGATANETTRVPIEMPYDPKPGLVLNIGRVSNADAARTDASTDNDAGIGDSTVGDSGDVDAAIPDSGTSPVPDASDASPEADAKTAAAQPAAPHEPRTQLMVTYDDGSRTITASLPVAVVINVAGDWHVVIIGVTEQDLTFTQHGRTVSYAGTGTTASGSINGDQFTLNQEGFVLTGTLSSPTDASGTYAGPGGLTGTWTAHKIS
jgi:hypothetical protein